jgi:hypothetical protein
VDIASGEETNRSAREQTTEDAAGTVGAVAASAPAPLAASAQTQPELFSGAAASPSDGLALSARRGRAGSRVGGESPLPDHATSAIFKAQTRPAGESSAGEAAVSARASDGDGQYAGRFKTADVPVPVPAEQGPREDQSSLRLEIASVSPEETNKSLAVWSARNNVRMEMLARGEVKVEGAGTRPSDSPGSDDFKSNEPADLTEELSKKLGAAKPKDAATEAPDTEIVLLLPKRQLPELMSYLNNQKGQRASLTLVQVMPGFHSSRLSMDESRKVISVTAPSATQPAAFSASQPATRPSAAALGWMAKADAGIGPATAATSASPGPEATTRPANTAAATMTRAVITPDAATSPDDNIQLRLPVTIRQSADAGRPSR